MNIIVAGCGKIGESIIGNLVSENLDITAIDTNTDVINEITNIYDIIGVHGNAADCETLSEAGAQRAELFVAVTGSDELNMLSCFMAKKMGAKHTIARIRNPQYNDKSLGFMRQQLGLSMSINPELLAARELFDILKLPSAARVEYFSRSNFEMIEMKVREDSALNGMRLADLSKFCKAKVLICLVQRDMQAHIPDGSFQLKAQDKIHIAATPGEMGKLLRKVGLLQKQAKSVMILGGSKTAIYLAKMLTAIGVSVKIIESDRQRCRELCELIPKAVIINGDGAGQELLLEEGLNNVDAFVALTGMDEENILISLFASSQNVPKVISKVNRKELATMAERLGLDCIVSPKETTSNIMIRYARALKNSVGSNVETLYKLMDGKAEALEFNVAPDSDVIDIPLKDLELKPNILIAGIIRGRKTIIPSGNDMILAEDRVIVIAANQRLQDLNDILM